VKLVKKPYVFAPALDKLLGDSKLKSMTLFWKALHQSQTKVDYKVLLQLLGHFKGRKLSESNKRVVVTAGSKSKISTSEANYRQSTGKQVSCAGAAQR
jgi:hypothetical protein